MAPAGVLGCLVRLAFFGLNHNGTITRSIVFIFMGLLPGLNAFYARFKIRFADNEPSANPADEEAGGSLLPDGPDSLGDEPQPRPL